MQQEEGQDHNWYRLRTYCPRIIADLGATQDRRVIYRNALFGHRRLPLIHRTTVLSIHGPKNPLPQTVAVGRKDCSC
jgi:hypothetical protein